MKKKVVFFHGFVGSCDDFCFCGFRCRVQKTLKHTIEILRLK